MRIHQAEFVIGAVKEADLPLLPWRLLGFRYLLTCAAKFAPYRENMRFQALRAFEQCLAALPGPRKLFYNGDMFGSGIDSVQTVEWLYARARGGITRGNHDPLTAVQPQPRDGNRPGSEDAALASLTPEQYQFTQQLPDQIHIFWRSMRIRMM